MCLLKIEKKKTFTKYEKYIKNKYNKEDINLC